MNRHYFTNLGDEDEEGEEVPDEEDEKERVCDDGIECGRDSKSVNNLEQVPIIDCCNLKYEGGTKKKKRAKREQYSANLGTESSGTKKLMHVFGCQTIEMNRINSQNNKFPPVSVILRILTYES